MARLGKRERQRAAIVLATVEVNLIAIRDGSLSAPKTIKRTHNGHLVVVNGSLASCANMDTLKASTRYGYRDNLHGKARPKPTSGMVRVDPERPYR